MENSNLCTICNEFTFDQQIRLRQIVLVDRHALIGLYRALIARILYGLIFQLILIIDNLIATNQFLSLFHSRARKYQRFIIGALKILLEKIRKPFQLSYLLDFKWINQGIAESAATGSVTAFIICLAQQTNCTCVISSIGTN